MKVRGGRGRPRKGNEPGERVALSLRVTKRANLQLRAAAAAHGRSLSQEGERRIERSFEQQKLAAEVLELRFGRRVAGLLMMLGETMEACLDHFGTLHVEAGGATSSAEGDEVWLKNAHAYE